MICSAYPGRPGCPNVGYSYLLNTSAPTSGAHVITVAATDSGTPPGTGTASVTITVSNVQLPLVYIDTPAQGSVLFGPMTITGWALDASSAGTAISRVQVSIDEEPVGNADLWGQPGRCRARIPAGRGARMSDIRIN